MILVKFNSSRTWTIKGLCLYYSLIFTMYQAKKATQIVVKLGFSLSNNTRTLR